MILILTAIHDRSVDAFQPITTVRAEGQAIRAFMDAINDPQNGPLYKHPDDYDMYRVGTYDDATGEITPEKPKKLADGKQLSTNRE